jgi:hypothetical protein
MTLVPAQQDVDALATIRPEEKIAYDGEIYNMPSRLADAPEGRFTLAALRDKLMA